MNNETSINNGTTPTNSQVIGQGVVQNTTNVAGVNQPVSYTASPVTPQSQVINQVNPTSQIPSTPVNNTIPSQTQVPIVTPNKEVPPVKTKKPKKKKGKLLFIIFLLLIIGGMTYYIYTDYLKDMRTASLECSPVSTTSKITVLDINSPLVQELYSKVVTNIKEDVASTNLDDNMKIYLAYRQIANNEIYESNCNLFSDTAMMPYTCHVSTTFTPTAFKEEILQRELKTLFGEKTNISNQNIQLGRASCIGGYQYIKSRGEYVEGYCEEVPSTSYQVIKTLDKATSQESYIKLYEKVDYMMAESNDLPSNLKDGTYVYTFQLDKNYNYIYIGKALEE